jgi:hypothetical protein
MFFFHLLGRVGEVEASEGEVEFGVIVLLAHRRDVEVMAAKLKRFEVVLYVLEYISEQLVLQDTPDSKQTDMQRLRFVQSTVVIVHNIHIFELTRHNDLFLKHQSHQLVG